MVLPPSEPKITITGSNRLVRPAGDLRGPLGVAPFKELHITSTVMKGDGLGGREWRAFWWHASLCVQVQQIMSATCTELIILSCVGICLQHGDQV